MCLGASLDPARYGFLSALAASLPSAHSPLLLWVHISMPGQVNIFTPLPAAKSGLCAFSRFTSTYQASRLNVHMFPAWLCGGICDSECKTGDSISCRDSEKPPQDWLPQLSPSQNPGGHDVALIYPKLRLGPQTLNKHVIERLSVHIQSYTSQEQGSIWIRCQVFSD